MGNPDIIYQDIAQRNQVQIFNENAKIFSTTKKAMLIIKARAIASNRTDRSIINSAVREIKDFKVREIIDLKPYDVGNYFAFSLKICTWFLCAISWYMISGFPTKN